MNEYFHNWYLRIAVLLVGITIFGCVDEVPGQDDFFEHREMYPYEFDGVAEIEGPDRLLFLNLLVGETHVEEAKITNVGRTKLHIDEFIIDEHFDLEVPQEFVVGDSYLRPDESISIQVSYTAPDLEAREGVLTVVSSDPEQPRLDIELLANVELPCFTIDPPQILNLGSVQRGESGERQIRLTNCSESQDIEYDLEDLESGGAFSLREQEGSERIIEAGSTKTIGVVFAPEEVREYNGSVTITSEYALEEDRVVEFRGNGTPPPCPEAVITGYSDQEINEASPHGELEGIPLETVTFDSHQSTAQAEGASIVDYEWTLVSSPQDTFVNLGQPADSVENDLYLELSGVYIVELHVWDTEGTRSCEPARMVVDAISPDAIHLQLVWDTPTDNDPHDSQGSDLDLHFLHEDGQWNTAPYDVNWMNMFPEWEDGNNSDTNPRLDIDKVHGWGPENINLLLPEDGVKYSVGVDYFADHGFGSSYATVRIFIHGQLAIEMTDRHMEDGEFWHVADIDWPSEEITVRDVVTDGFPQ